MAFLSACSLLPRNRGVARRQVESDQMQAESLRHPVNDDIGSGSSSIGGRRGVRVPALAGLLFVFKPRLSCRLFRAAANRKFPRAKRAGKSGTWLSVICGSMAPRCDR
tara:strand:- start:1025 stop:1348 length:324 start_codon:yes stop_codon:yes gene_type:complete